MPRTPAPGLTPGQIEDFITDGFVRLDTAFPTELAAQCRALMWQRLGLSPDRPEGWTEPVLRIPYMTEPEFVQAATTPTLRRAYDQLAGKGRWVRPTGLGSIPVRFPSDRAPGDDGWHVDVSFGNGTDYFRWRVNVTSRGRALLMLFLFSDVGPDDAPTRIRVGSHQQIARTLLPHGEAGMTAMDLVAEGIPATADCPQTLATGAAGTVYLCHPFLVHAAQPHRGRVPRFMAQPPLRPRGRFDPGLPPSPVQTAIRRACGLPDR